MNDMKNRYLWYTDCHLDRVNPLTKLKLITNLRKEEPKALFLTGDISNGIMTYFDLKMLATLVDCPIYFVLGNHDYHCSSFEETHDKIKELCKKHSNLIWLTQSDVVPLSDEIALIGTEGWYDARIGNPTYLKATLDWLLIKDLKNLPTMEDRVQFFRKLSDQSCAMIEEKLVTALDKDYKTVYILTHFPPWKEATRDVGTLLEKFWLPYNVNLALGETIERVMLGRNKRNVTVLCGHTHDPEYIRVSRNIHCQVGKPGGWFKLDSQVIYV